jgi:uncharacterized protein
MSLSMYQASVPVLIRALENLSHILDAGAAHAKAKGTDEANYVSMRLIPDMLPLSRQVQIACDISKGCGARLAGLAPPVHEDTEKSFADLQARCAKVVEYLKTLKPEQIDGSEEREIVIKSPRGEMSFKGQAFLFGYVLANVHFHSTMAYALLRGAGVQLGKNDYLLGANKAAVA